MGRAEHDLISAHLASLTPDKRRFRINAGMGWSGETSRLKNGDIIIHNPRPFHGAPKGFPDTVGWDCVEITPGMVGKKIAVFVGEEFKTGKLKLSREQGLFKKCLERMGGVFRVIR
ncbi:MAG: hypothetical protein LBG22_09585 [Treponema sp.]|jgi:hypothetical protein|nr:hypothetical protein [Treponema sp.]